LPGDDWNDTKSLWLDNTGEVDDRLSRPQDTGIVDDILSRPSDICWHNWLRQELRTVSTTTVSDVDNVGCDDSLPKIKYKTGNESASIATERSINNIPQSCLRHHTVMWKIVK